MAVLSIIGLLAVPMRGTFVRPAMSDGHFREDLINCLAGNADSSIEPERSRRRKMRRDMELVRRLLFFVEERGSRLFKGNISIEGYERPAIIHHLYLLVDAGYVELGRDTLADKGPLVLTWKGCNYVDELRGRQARPRQG